MTQSTRKRTARASRPVAKLHFLGATRFVTGSLYILEFEDDGKTVRFFVDMGLAQEDESLNHQNRLVKGMKAGELSFGIFTHAHLDHSGFFPKIYKDGFRGPVYATPPTADLLKVILPDSGYLQEEESAQRDRRAARRATRQQDAPRPARKGRTAGGVDSGARPPLYTQAIAEESLSLVQAVDFGKLFKPHPLVSVEFKRASHLLGAAVVVIDIGQGSSKRRIVFSGDLGRPSMSVLRDLEKVKRADYLLCESTYGNRLHPKRNRLQSLADAIKSAHERACNPHKKYGHGVILIPAFSVERVQAVLYDLKRLMVDGRIPEMPVFVDSPMANRATAIYRRHTSEFSAEALNELAKGDLFSPPRFAEITSAEASKRLDEAASEPVIIISSSGMATGGRVVHHLKKRLPGEQNTVIFVGYQAQGTLGQQILNPEMESVTISGEEVHKRAHIEKLDEYSGHADYQDIGVWLKGFEIKPKRMFLVHGNEESMFALKDYVGKLLPSWDVHIPIYRESVDLI